MKGNRSLNILFMGTPYFAVPSLELMVKEGFNVKAVATVADKPAGRGYKLQESAVKKSAKALGLKVLQPVDLNEDSFIEELKALEINLIVIVAFRKLPNKVFEFPEFGTFNLHGSLLPDYRGAAPLNWAVINGDRKTGVTTFFLEEKIDTGEIIDQREISVDENASVGEIHDELMIVGAELVVDTLRKIENGTCETKPQDLINTHRKAPKIFKKDCKVDWSKPVQEIHNLIRGLSPYPAAFTNMEMADGKSKKVKLFGSRVERETKEGGIGSLKANGDKIEVACTDGTLSVSEIQVEGKQKTAVADYLRGNSIEGCTFS